MSKSPFFVIPEFISPMMCEDIIDLSNFTTPDRDKNEKPILTTRINEVVEALIFNRVSSIVPAIEQHYDCQYKGTEDIRVEWYPPGSNGSFRSENSKYIRQKWVRTSTRDLTGVLFLVDYQDQVPFDPMFEVYGGKLEFPQHNFGLNPQRGTLVVFPSDPHFINGTTEVAAGDLYQARFHIVNQNPYWYNPDGFPGDYTTWFN